MSATHDMVDLLKTRGFIDRKEAAELLGRTDGGSFPDWLRRHKVEELTVRGNAGKERRLYRKADVEKIAAQSQTPDAQHIVGGESNGGKMRARLKAIEERIEELEKWKALWD